jgi:hypothetical protein
MIPKDNKKDDMTARIDLNEDDKIVDQNVDQDKPEEENAEETLAGALLTEEILYRLYSMRLVNPFNYKKSFFGFHASGVEDKQKSAWLTELPLLADRSMAYSFAKNRYAIVQSHDQKPFKISTQSVTARDMDVTATSAFDMAMAASLNPKMIKKGVTVTAADPSAAFLLMFAVHKAGLHITNQQNLMQLAQAHPDAYNAAKQQWEAAYPQLTQAFNEKAVQSSPQKQQAQPVKQKNDPVIDIPTGVHAGDIPQEQVELVDTESQQNAESETIDAARGWNPADTEDMVRRFSRRSTQETGGLKTIFEPESEVQKPAEEAWFPRGYQLNDIQASLTRWGDEPDEDKIGIREVIRYNLPGLNNGEDADEERVQIVVDKLLERGFLEQDESGNLSLKQKSTTPAADSKPEPLI